MADGSVREFKGKQRVDYRYTQALDRGETVDLLRNDLKSFPGIQVAPDAQGVRLTLSDAEGAVYFDPESSEIRPDQQRRLESLSGLLEQFRGRDILITGHTADFGTERGRYLLSMDRAAAVAGVLFPEGKNGSGRLFLRGMGSGEPVGTDAENRRVEVLILD
jgi:outer membrane protein OmpA-like peptidoglycan-associated protein